MRLVSMRPLRPISSAVTTSTGTVVSTFVRGVREPTTTIVSLSSCAVASAKSSFAAAPTVTLTTRSSDLKPVKSARSFCTPGGASIA